MLLVLFLIAVVGEANYIKDSGLGSEDEAKLIDSLFLKQGYNPLIRPVHNLNESLIVAFNVALIQIINIDEKNQVLLSNVWLRMSWTDYQLRWDPYEYGGISVFRIASSQVWKPDIVLFNNLTYSADGRYEVSYKSNVVLSHTGEVLWVCPAIYKSSCIINVEYFPFDEQECKLKFGSWTFNGDQVRLDWYDKKKLIDLTDYVQSATWDIMDCPGNLHMEFDRADMQNKSYVQYTLRIRRKPLYYTTNLIIPCILISLLSVCVFFLPPDALEKMTLCVSILLAMTFFLLLISKILPPTSLTVSLIAKYLLFTFMMNLIAIFCTVTIINWNFRMSRTHPMSPLVRSLMLNFLPRIIFMKRPNHEKRFGARGGVKSEGLYNGSDGVNNNEISKDKNSKNRLDSGNIGYKIFKYDEMATNIKPAVKFDIQNSFKSSKKANTQNYGTKTVLNENKKQNPHENESFLKEKTYKKDSANYNFPTKTKNISDLSDTRLYLIETDKALKRSFTVTGKNLSAHKNPSSLRRSSTTAKISKTPFNIPFSGNTMRAVKAIKFVAEHLKKEQEVSEMMSDWRYMALVIDRLLLYIFFAVIVFGAISILINAPYIFEHVDQDAIIKSILNTQHGIGHLEPYKKDG